MMIQAKALEVCVHVDAQRQKDRLPEGLSCSMAVSRLCWDLYELILDREPSSTQGPLSMQW